MNEELRREITERQQVAEALRESEERFSKAFRSSPVTNVILRLDDECFLDVNDAFSRMFGYERTEVVGQTALGLGLWLNPQQRVGLMQVLREAGAVRDYETRARTKSGAILNLLVFMELIELGGERSVLATACDITDRKRAEEALRQSEFDLAEAQRVARLGNWSFDIVANTVRWSEALYSIFDVEKTAFGGTFETFLARVHPGDRARVLQVNADARSSGKPFEVKYRITTRNGQLRHIREVGYARKDSSGLVSGLFGTAQDITESKRAEEQLIATSEELRALSASLQSAREEERAGIARELHDELGSALTSLAWDLEGLDKILSGSGNRVKTSEMRDKVRVMMRVTDTTIHTVRRISSELRPSILDDLGLEAAIEWQAQQFQARTGIVCQYDFLAENLDLNRERAIAIFRIFQEALTNILRHAHATRVTITTEEEEGQFVLQIRDNGRGITEEQRTGSRSLGLIGMRERAHLIGGKIEITGVAGKGTVLTMRVPLAERTFS